MLDGVLGLLGGAEHVAAEGEDAAVVAVVDRLERGLGAAADELDEAVVGGEAEQPGGDPWAGTCGPRRGRGFHRARIIDRMLGRQERFPALLGLKRSGRVPVGWSRCTRMRANGRRQPYDCPPWTSRKPPAGSRYEGRAARLPRLRRRARGSRCCCTACC